MFSSSTPASASTLASASTPFLRGQIALELLPPTLSSKVQEIVARHGEDSAEALEESVRGLLLEPDGLDIMMAQARQWFTQNLYAIESIEASDTAQTASSTTSFSSEGQALLWQEAEALSREARFAAAQAIKSLNSRYERNRALTAEAEAAAKEENALSLEQWQAAFFAFYSDMEEVQRLGAQVSVNVLTLQAHQVVESAVGELESKYTHLSRLEQRIQQVGLQLNPQPTQSTSDITRREWLRQNLEGREVAVFEKEELDELLREQKRLKQEVELIERLRQMPLERVGEEYILEMMKKVPPLEPVALRLEQALCSYAEMARHIKRDQERYKTRQIADAVFERTGHRPTLDDVAYHLEALVGRGRIENKEAGRQWWLGRREMLPDL